MKVGSRLALCASVHALAIAYAGPSFAQETPAVDRDSGEIIVTGTRRQGRSVAESSVPIDVVTSQALEATVSSDLQDKLAQSVPSYSVQTKPLYGPLIFVRPASLRGLNPDQTLVLINGKRQHRSAFVNFNVLGGGAQGVDLSQISSSATGRIEVLRDGASAQYGSDAIAGVINIILDDKPGLRGFVQGSRYYEGDGENLQAGLSGGLRLGDRGAVNASFEYTNGNRTSRSLQRAEAAALIAAGNTAVRQPAVTTWGQPDIETYRLSLNGHYELSDAVDLYGFGLFGDSWGESNLNWRSPNSSSYRRSVFQNAPYNIFPTYSPASRFPGGFTPFLSTDGQDVSLFAGLRGDLTERLSYDLSGSYGRNRLRFHSRDTLNPTLGPDSPTEFDLGRTTQSEWGANLDFVYRIDAGLATPINLAFGGEWRRERYAVAAGEYASYAVGPLADLPSGSGGQVGILPDAAGSWSRSNVSLYADVDVDLSERFNIGAAGRYEHYSDFGSTVNGKLSSRLDLVKGLSLRGAASTGFRAPTPGQSNSTNTTQSPDPNRPGQIFVLSLIPPTSALARSLGAKPLEPEKSVNLSLGVVAQPASGLTLTADWYRIRVKDRLTTSQLYEPVPGQRINFFVNGYTTRASGLDVVLTYAASLGADRTLTLTAAGNYNDTKLARFDPGVIGAAQKIALERRLPRTSATLSADLGVGRFDFNARARYYGSTVDLFFDSEAFQQRIGAETFLDISATYRATPHLRIIVGAENILDNYPDRVNWGGPPSPTNFLDFGRLYPSALPYSTDGGRYYARVAFDF